MIKISIYQNNKKILGGITNIEEDKVKQIADTEISSLVPTIKKNMLICPNDKSPKEFAIENSSKSQVVEFVQWGGTHSDSVAQYVTYKFIRGTDLNWGTLVAIINDTNYRRTIKYCGYDGYREDGAKWGDWINVNTSKIPDVPKTKITWSDETYFKSNAIVSTENYFQVRNGVCYVNIDVQCVVSKSGGYTLPITLPKPAIDYVHAGISSLPVGTGEHSSITIGISNSGNSVIIYGGITNNRYLGTFSYPVAES